MCSKHSRCIAKTNASLVELVLFGFPLRYLTENFIALTVSYAFQMFQHFSDPDYKSRLILSSVLFGGLLTASLGFIVFVGVNLSYVKTSKLKALVLGMNLKSPLYSQLYYLNFMSIRLLVSLLLILSELVPSMYLWTIFTCFQLYSACSNLLPILEERFFQFLVFLYEAYILIICAYSLWSQQYELSDK